MKKKKGNYFVQDLINMVDEVEQTSQNPICFHAWFLLNMASGYLREAQRFSNWWVLLEDFHAHVSDVESMPALIVWLRFKNWKWIILRWSYHTNSIISTFILSRLRKFILFNRLPLELNIIIKDQFFVAYNDILEKLVIERRFIAMIIRSSLFFSLKA